MSGLNVAILGATGVVGTELLKILEERSFPIATLKLLASPRSAGKRVRFKDQELVIEAVGPDAFRGIDIAFFSAGGSVSKEWAPVAVSGGALVIDNTSAFRLDPDVPLVVPEVNADAISDHKGIIANPNCSTIIMAVPLAPIHRRFGIRRVVVSTYQAVSGAGLQAMQELEEQVRAYVEGRPMEVRALHHQIAFNLIPHIDVFQELGYTKEEWKMVHEARKILGAPDLKVSPTTVRVPVLRSHSEAINVETKEHVPVDELRKVLEEAEGVEVVDDPERLEYPMPWHVSGKDSVFVGRIRQDPTVENGINMFVVGDQIRKGAALNAVQIAERAHAKGLIKGRR